MNDWATVTLSSMHWQPAFNPKSAKTALLLSTINSGQIGVMYSIPEVCALYLPCCRKAEGIIEDLLSIWNARTCNKKSSIKLRCVECVSSTRFSVQLMLILLWTINFGIVMTKKPLKRKQSTRFTQQWRYKLSARTLIDYRTAKFAVLEYADKWNSRTL